MEGGAFEEISLTPEPEEGKLLPLWRTPDGWHILRIHHSAVPHYNYEQASQGLSLDGVERELELNWNTTVGKRVYPTFGDGHHVAKRSLPFNPRQPLYCGWDFGTPAFVPSQINALGQWQLFPSLSPLEETTIGVYEFGEMVADFLLRRFAMPNEMKLEQLRLIHIGDPAGAGKIPLPGEASKETTTAFEILDRGLLMVIGYEERGKPLYKKQKGWGWKIRPGAVNITDRLESVRSRLNTNLMNGIPALIVDPEATTVVEGFLGGYHYKQRADGSYEWDPHKNYYSHTMDALGYVATRLFARHKPDKDEDAPKRPRHVVTSHASGRYSEW